jgi:mono/diheme cytochrome c family protein
MMNTAQFGIGLILMAVVGVGQPSVYGQVEVESELARIAKGERVYVKHCAGCHGSGGKGDGYKILGADPADLTSPAITRKSDAALLNAIHEGKPTMPSWKVRLSEDDSRDVLAYIRTLSK